MLTVEGDENKPIYSGQINDQVYLPEGAAIATPETAEVVAPPAADSRDQRILRGKTVFAQNCQTCHQANGQGIASAFPPLANSDYLNAEVNRSIRVVLNGLEGPVTVNGALYNSLMPKLNLSDEQVANVLTFVYDSWGNNGTEVTPQQVAAQR